MTEHIVIGILINVISELIVYFIIRFIEKHHEK